MKNGAGIWMNILAAATVAALLPGAIGKSPFSGLFRPERNVAEARFHAGKPVTEGSVDPACAGKGCHAPSSHRRGGGAAFLNMHGETVSCLACHGKEHEKHWTVSPSGTDRRARLAYSQEGSPGGPHDALGAVAPCERCHSEDGKERIATAGWKEIPQGFASPIPMRMLREGGRKWVPDDVR